MRSWAIVHGRSGWTSECADLLAGSHIAVLSSGKLDEMCLEGRTAGFVLRDTLIVLGPRWATFILLFRSCLTVGVAEQVLKTGTGGLNVHACRVGNSKPKVRNIPFNSWRLLENRQDLQRPGQTYNPNEGRWPSNVLLVHSPDCEAICAPGCPVAILGGQAQAFQQFRDPKDVEGWLGRLLSEPKT